MAHRFGSSRLERRNSIADDSDPCAGDGNGQGRYGQGEVGWCGSLFSRAPKRGGPAGRLRGFTWDPWRNDSGSGGGGGGGSGWGWGSGGDGSMSPRSPRTPRTPRSPRAPITPRRRRHDGSYRPGTPSHRPGSPYKNAQPYFLGGQPLASVAASGSYDPANGGSLPDGNSGGFWGGGPALSASRRAGRQQGGGRDGGQGGAGGFLVMSDWLTCSLQSLLQSRMEQLHASEQVSRRQLMAETAEMVLNVLDARSSDDALAHRSEVSALRRLQRESFSDLLHLRDRLTRLELLADEFSLGQHRVAPAAFLAANSGRTEVSGRITVGSALVPTGGLRSHRSRAAMEAAGLRSGVQMALNLASLCRSSDRLSTVLGVGPPDPLGPALALGGPVVLQKAVYRAQVAEGLAVTAAPMGASGADLVGEGSAGAGVRGDSASNQPRGLTTFSSGTIPLLQSIRGSALAVTVDTPVPALSPFLPAVSRALSAIPRALPPSIARALGLRSSRHSPYTPYTPLRPSSRSASADPPALSFTAGKLVAGWGVPLEDPSALAAAAADTALCTSAMGHLALRFSPTLRVSAAAASHSWPAPPAPSFPGLHWSEMGPLVLPRLGGIFRSPHPRGGGARGGMQVVAEAGSTTEGGAMGGRFGGSGLGAESPRSCASGGVDRIVVESMRGGGGGGSGCGGAGRGSGGMSGNGGSGNVLEGAGDSIDATSAWLMDMGDYNESRPESFGVALAFEKELQGGTTVSAWAQQSRWAGEYGGGVAAGGGGRGGEEAEEGFLGRLGADWQGKRGKGGRGEGDRRLWQGEGSVVVDCGGGVVLEPGVVIAGNGVLRVTLNILIMFHYCEAGEAEQVEVEVGKEVSKEVRKEVLKEVWKEVLKIRKEVWKKVRKEV
ncbi:unnamed protein product [Closterium sp. NIES-64]|nr:unnamed protein product [Closterium sp. NIES-64]CAI6011857.1 unnamed protein product [Closterium sp. NIES-65]